jgi:hypothetical protein
MEMEIISYRGALVQALEQLCAHDEKTCGELLGFLYDWSNCLLVCHTQTQVLLLDKNLNQVSREILENLGKKLKYLDKDMRGALLDYTQKVSDAKSE